MKNLFRSTVLATVTVSIIVGNLIGSATASASFGYQDMLDQPETPTTTLVEGTRYLVQQQVQSMMGDLPQDMLFGSLEDPAALAIAESVRQRDPLALLVNGAGQAVLFATSGPYSGPPVSIASATGAVCTVGWITQGVINDNSLVVTERSNEVMRDIVLAKFNPAPDNADVTNAYIQAFWDGRTGKPCS